MMNFAFLFPGQGSQSVGMLDDLSKKYPEVRSTFQEGSDILSQNLWKLVHKGPESELNLTVNTQPVLFLTSYAIWKIWDNLTDETPSFMCGHSLGEYSALACAGAINFRDGLLLVRKRAEIMQSAVPKGKGAMLAIISLDQNTIKKLCGQVDGVAEIANINSSEQVVVAGEKAAIKQLKTLADEADAHKTVILPVSVPSHSSLMKTGAEEFAEYLKKITIKEPSVPIFHNVDAVARTDADDIKEALVKQLHSPVQWLKTMKELSQEGIENFIEVGPGRVLCGLARRIDRSMNVFSLKDCASLDKTLQEAE